MTDRQEARSAATVCHCGRTVEPRDPDPWEGRMDDYCEDCATNRCDCYPGKCPVKHPQASSAATMPGQDDSWATFAVKPSRSPHGEYVFVEIAAKQPHGRATAHFQLSRQDAFDLAARLSNAAEWLRREAS